ncbi:MAG: succinate--CoA ligase subunit alpha [Myxococcales bacterium]|nr:succinate--CoA ligase subunit alpha [Myxococcales bacterium]
MSILVDKNTRVVIQGITGGAGSFHARQMIAYGTQVVAGVTPGKGGSKFDDRVPVFDTVARAVAETGADTSCIFVPPAFCADAIAEAAAAGVRLVVVITEGIPTLDMIAVRRLLDEKGVRMVGPNCPGVLTPGECKVGIAPGYVHRPGRVGVVSRSGTLTYEAVWQLSALGIGQSTCIGIGGDPVGGIDFVDALTLFEADRGTDAVVLIGEIGGAAEERAAAFIREHVRKPVAAFIAGVTAPPGKRMGHAGAIISGSSGKAADKIEALRAAGVAVTANPAEIGVTLRAALAARPAPRRHVEVRRAPAGRPAPKRAAAPGRSAAGKTATRKGPAKKPALSRPKKRSGKRGR